MDDITRTAQHLGGALDEFLQPDIAFKLARQLSVFLFRGGEDDLEQVRRCVAEGNMDLASVQLLEIRGVAPFHGVSSVELECQAFRQGVLAMFWKVFEKLSGDLHQHALDIVQIVDESESEIGYNNLFGGKRGADVMYRQGVTTAKNRLIKFFTQVKQQSR